MTTLDRPDWDNYFMSFAKVAATRATCHRKHVGCVLVNRNNHIIATGYNGSPPGKEHCGDDNHEMVDGHCVRTIHAECNAIAQAARQGAATLDSTCYVTIIPCYDCAKMLISAGISRVIFHNFYQSRYEMSDKVSLFLKSAGVPIRQMHFNMTDTTSLIQD